MRKILTVLIIFCTYFYAGSQDKIMLAATKYNLEIRNNFTHSVQLELKSSNQNDTFFLKPQEVRSVPGRYSRFKLEKKVIVCGYNEVTFGQDQILQRESMQTIRDSIARESTVKDSLVLEDFAIAVQPDLTVDKKRLAERNLIYVNQTERLKSYLFEVKQKNISDYNDLESTILVDRFDKAAIDKIYTTIEKIVDLDLNDTIINAIIYTADKLSMSREQRVTKTLEIEEKLNSENAKLALLKNDIRFSESNTYKVRDLLNETSDFKGRSPNYILSAYVLSFGDKMNDQWYFSRDNVYERSESEDKIVGSNGLVNRTLGLGFYFPVFREFHFSKQFYSRLYAGLSFHNTSFTLDREVEFSDSFFSSTPSNGAEPVLDNPLSFEQQQVSAEIKYKAYLLNFLTLDVFGGYMMQQGGLNFRLSELSGGHRWQNEYLKITGRHYKPVMGWQIGLGVNSFHGGTWITFGMRYFKIDHENISDLILTDQSANSIVTYSSVDKLISHSHIGLSIAF